MGRTYNGEERDRHRQRRGKRRSKSERYGYHNDPEPMMPLESEDDAPEETSHWFPDYSK